jgi:hypothetical protein
MKHQNLSRLILLIIILLIIFVMYILYKKRIIEIIKDINLNTILNKYNNATIEQFSEKTLYENPKQLIETGYNPAFSIHNKIPNDIFNKYSIIEKKRDLNEYSDILYLGNPL